MKSSESKEYLTEEDRIFQATLDHMNMIWQNAEYDIKTKRIMINKIIPVPFCDRLTEIKPIAPEPRA